MITVLNSAGYATRMTPEGLLVWPTTPKAVAVLARVWRKPHVDIGYWYALSPLFLERLCAEILKSPDRFTDKKHENVKRNNRIHRPRSRSHGTKRQPAHRA